MPTSPPVSPDRRFIGYTDGPLLGSTVRVQKTIHLKIQGRDKVFRLRSLHFVAEHILDENSRVLKRVVRRADACQINPTQDRALLCMDAFVDQLREDGYEVV